MRSRTEMVTTTFVDSEEDYSDDDDSEEDWRPSASNKNGKKQKQQHKSGGIGQTKRGRKRKNSSAKSNKNSKRKATYENSDNDDVDDISEEDYESDDFEVISGSSKKHSNLPPKKQFSEKNSPNSGNEDTDGNTFNLLVYVKDLLETDLNKNNRLCLWRKDKNNLLQKYIRVKTTSEEFIFTSSSVYSRFDEKRFSDFYDIKVKFIDSSNRRVKIVNPSELQKLYLRVTKNENNSDDDNLSDEKSDKQICVKFKENRKNKPKHVPKYDIEDDDDEEEVEEENDEEEDDCNLEGDDDDDIEEDDEVDDE